MKQGLYLALAIVGAFVIIRQVKRIPGADQVI